VDRWVPETAPVPPLSLSTSGEGENRPGRAYLHLLLVVAKLAFFLDKSQLNQVSIGREEDRIRYHTAGITITTVASIYKELKKKKKGEPAQHSATKHRDKKVARWGERRAPRSDSNSDQILNSWLLLT